MYSIVFIILLFIILLFIIVLLNRSRLKIGGNYYIMHRRANSFRLRKYNRQEAFVSHPLTSSPVSEKSPGYKTRMYKKKSSGFARYLISKRNKSRVATKYNQ